MSEIAGRTGRIDGPVTGQQTGHRSAATAIVNESYSFACMRCGHGWEQSYEIEHHHDAEGSEFVMYVAEGRVVPSPLSRPSCQNCDGHVVRIMRAGQVSSVQNSMHRTHHPDRPLPRQPAQVRGEGPDVDLDRSAAAPEEPHHWHLSDLLHPFHHRRAS
ncbi:hypothetical protein [Streptomyces sp. NBC_01571]|uniref:hypothetical protein n=1 Tax=unclassified Streptomyces TaxID=2593676 RepID=UPI00225617A8|nr:hypothetical protein [Streptomyces sp. NBC_01571]MCX4575524.1 hypothetical protein [Streptomyces sp. NBC_01571]